MARQQSQDIPPIFLFIRQQKKSCKRPQKCCPENELTLSDRGRMMIVAKAKWTYYLPLQFYTFYVCDTFDSSLELIFISKNCIIQIEERSFIQ